LRFSTGRWRDHGQKDDAEAALHLGVLVQLVDEHPGMAALFQPHGDAHALAVGFVAHVAEALPDCLSFISSAIFSTSLALLTW
jgi:hypothetical protein